MIIVDFRKKSDIKWVKESSISMYHLICAGYDTNITIRKGNLFLSRTTRNGRTVFTDAGTNPKKWYLTDGWYTYYNIPFDTLDDAKAYAVHQFMTGRIKGGEWKEYNPNRYPFRKE